MSPYSDVEVVLVTGLEGSLKGHGRPPLHLRHGVEMVVLFAVHHGQDLPRGVTILTGKNMKVTQDGNPLTEQSPQTSEDP